MTTFALSNRRNWIQGLGALSACAQSGRPQRHFVVVGAGIFGAWTAYHLLRAGQRVTLIDQYGPANSRASSGGESRIIRARYGNDVVYTSFALRSLQLWQRFLNETSLHRLYHRVGALWMARQSDPRFAAHLQTLRKLGAEVHSFDNTELKRRYPQIHVDDDVAAILEPNAGGLMARQAVQAVVTEFVKKGGVYRQSRIQEPAGTSRLQELIDHRSERIAGDAFVFAAGPWLKTLLPGVLGDRIFPTRQVVFFYGPPPGDSRFAPPAMPAWGDAFSDLPWYGLPDLENRGFKLAFGWLGEDFDPDRSARLPMPDEISRARDYLKLRFPALAAAPLVEARVCQYENTANTDFLIDRHPGWENAWIAGGGSGHGFKHGPAIGEYTAARALGLADPPVEPRFSLASKATKLPNRTQQRP